MIRALFSVLVSVCIAGCASMSSSGGRGPVDEIHLFGLPITINMDGQPGADGFAARIYVTMGGSAKGARVKSGALEVWMFDGVVRTDDLLTQTPLQKWRFPARELNRLQEQTSLGQGYRFALRWKEAPKHNHITIIARFVPEKGQPVYSSPSTISAAAK
jgi:hypothetical protein